MATMIRNQTVHARLLKGAILLLLLTLTTSQIGAQKPGNLPLRSDLANPGRRHDGAPSTTPVRQDTLWFGGDDGAGVAFQGGVWDWDTIVTDPFQGWTSVDHTENPGDYFDRVTRESFLEHGDPCIPIQIGNEGMLWCGIHEDEAVARDFVDGMGYQNRMCQWAFSPRFGIDPESDAIDVSFYYFNHTEPTYDYTHVVVRCFNAAGARIDEHRIDSLTGIVGDPLDLAFCPGLVVPPGTLLTQTVEVQIAFQMEADGGWSDEDGLWPTPCGPFGTDDIAVTVGQASAFYDFEDGPQGWTFERCSGTGAFMAVIPEEVWIDWLEYSGVACECGLEENALCFADVEGSPWYPPGMAAGQKEEGNSGAVPGDGYDPEYYNTTVVQYDRFLYQPPSSGAHYRPGYKIYPYTTEVNPEPHWSPRLGQYVWWYWTEPLCDRDLVNLSLMGEEPIPTARDSMRFIYEVYCSCDAFAVPPTLCNQEGMTGGSPLLDNLRVGLVHTPDAPPVALADGGQFQDGFGQNYPTYLEPSDRGNANVSFDLSMQQPGANDWLGDSAVVSGPMVSSEADRWLVNLCLRVARTGARQEMIPEYQAWKQRFLSDPEEGFVCALMDSLETMHGTQVWPHRFATYFHEEDPGFDHARADWTAAQEILPDGVFVPGTQIEYYYASFFYNGGAPAEDHFVTPVGEFAILPGMRDAPGEEYDVAWPCVLYVDAYNRGAERRIAPMLAALGLEFDTYDYLDATANYNASLMRSYGGGVYNPGGYGNNGCTVEQLLGYRLILLNTGFFGHGTLEPSDFVLLEQWLDSSACGLGDQRRGLILNGNNIGGIMGDPVSGIAIDFAQDILGFNFVWGSYRDYNDDEAECVYLEPIDDPHFAPLAPGVSLFGNDCPQMADFDVLGVQPGVENALGHLRYFSYEGTGTYPYVDFAQVVRTRREPGVADWRAVVDGFSLNYLSERGCEGEPCADDSACVVSGGIDLLTSELAWLADGGAPFDPWRYPCFSTGVEPRPEAHLHGPATMLYASRPNPFHRSATIRFRLAAATQVEVGVYDVSGRLIRRLVDGALSPGDHARVWDGTDAEGRRVGGGIYWTQMQTADGYRSSKRLLVLR